MSKLSYLDKLLDGVVVEWKTLGEVAKYIRGLTYSKSNESADGQGYRVLRANNITLSSNCLNLNDVKVVKFDTKVKDSQKLYKDDILISAASGSREHVGKVAYIESDIDYYFGGFMGVVRCDEKLNPRYLFHVLTSDIFQKYLDEMLNSSTINNLNSAVMGGFKIPIPCPNKPEKSLAIQSEIVRILDKFTALTAELTAELTMRKKQYNYYRDQLLSFDEGEVEWKTLGEVGHIVTGRTPKSSDKSAWGDDVDFVTPSDIKNGMRNITCPSRRLSAEGAASMPKVRIPRGSLLVTCIGADMGKTVINANDCIPNQQINAITLSDDSVQVGYLFHILTAMRETLRRQGELGGGTMPLINKSDFSKIVVPIPSHEEQNRIAKILDKFDTLTNSISEGLPREIELRQKQYEYYRDLLFSFPKPDSVTN
ncbi:restriction endonuclease subunit S [Obesumbacterium proteus]|uniref:Type I restriction-modification system, specificity subunit S n=1 Tax=Obesumbacterium proteus ATCC 12841 TaxID=1354268 RepID=A0AA91EEG5_9GAMM|nr:restriction endonuclease subunit S [Obesumbacterium proteus]OAT56757.1 type I restriction-modification system, specificity subunit S [Obesumbacterium proteus ATCC 12841]